MRKDFKIEIRIYRIAGYRMILVSLFSIFVIIGKAQPVDANKKFVSEVWSPDLGNGRYKNPVLNADYSDPDVIRVGNFFYLISSSFEDVPGIPILRSTDLVNWSIIGHALKKLQPATHFSVPRHGEGVWAPSIRFHNGEFYIYYPDPDFGIYLVKAKNAEGPWSDPVLVAGGKGLIDPCPLWDDDGQVYLVHAFAGSRAGIKSIIAVRKLNRSGTETIDDGVIVYDGHELDPTIEGPKFYKRNGYYYIFAPAGGVPTGWQLVLRSKKIYGPYERKIVMDQGSSPVNGPHQGAWVNTPNGEDWFLHFQDKGPYGRVVHLQPMKWLADWPVIGEDLDGDGKGQPVMEYKKPSSNIKSVIQTPADSDEFNDVVLGKQWQWMANQSSGWYMMNQATGKLRLYSKQLPDSAKNLWDAPSILLQKFPAEEFMVTTVCTFKPNTLHDLYEETGLVIMGLNYATIGLMNSGEGNNIIFSVCDDVSKKQLSLTIIQKQNSDKIFLRVRVSKNAICRFSFSVDGKNFTDAGIEFKAMPGRWKGAKVGLYCTRKSNTNDAGWADFDWFHVEMPQKN